MIYYYELPWEENPDFGQFHADSDEEALEHLNRSYPQAWCLYRESDTPDGNPFVMLYDHKKDEEK
jgi:hypothetical protein